MKKINLKKLKRGSEAIENILIVGIIIALIVTIFYPSINNLLDNIFSDLTVWVNNMTRNLFT